MEKKLQSILKDGVVSDLVEVEKSSLKSPGVVEPWSHLPIKFWKSRAVTEAFDVVLEQIVPGTSASYKQIVSSIMSSGENTFCFLLGGMVRDILLGQVGNDFDFNYTCSAQDVARVCVDNAWPLRFYRVANNVTPNKVVIGDPDSDTYLEGFSITFDAIAPCYKQDFRRNLLYYDLTNHVILDKSGHSISDVQTGQLRFSCAPSTDFVQWAGVDGHRADKMLRYVKFVVRAEMKQKSLKVNEHEAAFVIDTLTRDLRGENTKFLDIYWPFVFKEFMRSQQGLHALHEWVCKQSGASWWNEWLPFVRKHVKDESFLLTLSTHDAVSTEDVPADILKTVLECCGLTSQGLIDEVDLRMLLEDVGLVMTDQHELLLDPARSGCPPGKLKYAVFIDNLFGDDAFGKEPTNQPSLATLQSSALASAENAVEKHCWVSEHRGPSKEVSRQGSKVFDADPLIQAFASVPTAEEAGPKQSIDEAMPHLKKVLQASVGADGFLSDVVQCTTSELKDPQAVAPWEGHSYNIYRSAAATTAFRSVLRCQAPGTSNSYAEILSAISLGFSPKGGQQQHYCYLMGGQVRDVLRGDLSADIDFNYSCSPKEVALTTVAHDWPTKFKCVGGGITTPNYVLIGDEASSCYLEGFCVEFNTQECYNDDLTMNMLFYDLTNDVIIDKTARGVDDIRARAVRLSLAAGEKFESWAAANFSPGNKELRYVKFLLRGEAKGEPFSYDPLECAFIVESLRKSLQTNFDELRNFWFGYTLRAQLQDVSGVAALRAWVTRHGGPTWWEKQWEPLVRACAAPGALAGLA